MNAQTRYESPRPHPLQVVWSKRNRFVGASHPFLQEIGWFGRLLVLFKLRVLLMRFENRARFYWVAMQSSKSAGWCMGRWTTGQSALRELPLSSCSYGLGKTAVPPLSPLVHVTHRNQCWQDGCKSMKNKLVFWPMRPNLDSATCQTVASSSSSSCAFQSV